MDRRALVLALAALLLAASVPAAGEPFGDPDRGLGCTTLTDHAYREIPRLFVAGDADSLLVLIDRWDRSCGPHETITRARLLGAIWDGAFSEDLYGPDIDADLDQRAEEMALGAAPDSLRAAYDAFTVDLARQLLPHQDPESLESFFCLFYAGRTDAAWALLDSLGPGEGYLAARQDLLSERPPPAAPDGAVWTAALGAGSWNPGGDLAFVGDRPLLHVALGRRGPAWLGRLVGELRAGRSDGVWWVERDGVPYVTNRWNAWYLGAEAARRLGTGAEFEWQLLVGGGVDLVRPFGSDDLVLGAPDLAVGVGLRARPGVGSRWTWGLDLRHEWIGRRNEDAVPLGGTAWSLRFVVERLLRSGP